MRLEKNINDKNVLLLESILDRGIFKAVFLGGIAGAGKSYVSSRVKSGLIEPRVVNTDTWVEYYMRVKKGLIKSDLINPHDLWCDTSKKLVSSQLTQYLNSMLPLLCDQTSTRASTVVRRNGILERMGYDTAMIYVNTTLETAIERVNRRERKVPVEQVIEYYENAKKIKPYLKAKFPIFLEIKNDDGELTDDVILNAFKRMLFFYDNPVSNPIGVDIMYTMKEKGWKYLAPNIYTMSEIKSIAGDWYRK